MDILAYALAKQNGGGGGGSEEYPGYDLVISTDMDDSSAVPMVEKGNYADVLAKIQQNKFVSVAYYVYSSGVTTEFFFPYTVSYDSGQNWVIISCYSFSDQITFNIILQSDNTIIWGD